ncbi:hypothetical protein ZYGR_0H04570 [Zygosaccharomyces rouxii]|uniref:ZYRO0B14542p n=2 Tax=Zygosaccharomyces rouxii TaxID=4956 RepID=C5DS78_ZYGRC|nr:uncharacterized protein ZYRO0B14542g [Zygosaccharomyces rouxii]KAH9199832.1 cytochrome b5-like heme/steroid binding domain-containing protein [Zygosaccharomyces rouxii]GAV47611.1 hypothetical protein ZYGR_0H04570 [Zygosaccharomyces rouxii]CAR26639.1 ZYRO0B14542p [Zygosaccharomyces rouxii]
MAVVTDKKTDDLRIIYDSDDEDGGEDIGTTFTTLDIIRMLAGLIIAWCVVSRSFTNHWFYIPGQNSVKKASKVSPEIPTYWSTQELPVSFTLEQLSQYTGQGESGRILLSVKGHVFDVTEGESFYGKWGAYRKFAGTDCSNLFGYHMWDVSALGRKCNHDLSGLSEQEMSRVNSWLEYFKGKYPEVGYLEEDQ